MPRSDGNNLCVILANKNRWEMLTWFADQSPSRSMLVENYDGFGEGGWVTTVPLIPFTNQSPYHTAKGMFYNSDESQ